jgi:enoyl-[acyl-carrier protein] reductase II
LGVDAIIVTGYEAAAHGADATSLVLVPLVASQVKVPLIAAGGFSDGRGLAAALALGADAISMGTRFMVTKESNLHENFKRLLIEATEQDTLYSDVFDGMPGRALKSKAADELMKGNITLGEAIPSALQVKRVLKMSWWRFLLTSYRMMKGEERRSLFQQARMARTAGRQQKAIYNGDVQEGVLFAGQVTGAISDIPTCQELIERIVAEAEQTLEAMRAKVVA